MGFFEDSKPKISKREFEEARSALAGKGFSEREILEVQKIFRADLNDVREDDRGIDGKELDAALLWMREHIGEHAVSEKKLDILEAVLRKRL
ncbi:MAG: hypothetical protein A2408_02765 [Candidatus Yonathbacteria bacterium RIFOXYC1_FULL_52_10]|uniref:Uncharacterized protein n=1 Tax=Candidatus Yonathbacteria bacterium RIFOXYD1_FULL_52_36 TaxID=1802730 RepID=A0A1G2SK26_9BACT|nr:MAG: hypothetical protein A2408_02765 [Candidatus Yonathbacteria bacterium RIFOXYC1_FULL_52_10]OHA85028.1 MAG: hypothetical protein A2591_02305 [Candidatus Yonathbacteria bacterium RIFOXYD1_FULL_52_36]